VQVRTKGGPDAERVRLAREACAAARAVGMPLIVNDRPDVALIVGAAGVHVGQRDLPPAAARRILGPAAIVGISTHDVRQATTASGEPVDYVAIGPVFPTRTKDRPDPAVGLDGLRAVRGRVVGPLVAIGGITRENAAAVVGAGADGIAVIGALLGETDLEAAARALRRAFGPAR
jgi:thiamine-phosphate pyrophosphorylase